jgi:hypothetical protein
MNQIQIFKNMWRRLWQRRRNTSVSEETVQEARVDEIPDTPAPQYAEFLSEDTSENALFNNADTTSNSNYPYPLLNKLSQQSRNQRAGNLTWLLVEIMAITFSADCQRLIAALTKYDLNWAIWAFINIRTHQYSLLWKTSGAEIPELSALIQSLQIEMSRDRWLLVSGRDKNLIQKIVLEPVEQYNLNLDYVLEFVGRCKRVGGCGRPESTLVDYRMSSAISTDLGDTIGSHTLLLRSLELHHEVQDVLEQPITTYQEERGLKHLRTSRELQEESIKSLAETCCWRLNDEYMDLARGLRSWRMNGEIPDPSSRVEQD